MLGPVQGSIHAAYAIAINNVENPFSYFGCHADCLNECTRIPVSGTAIVSIPKGATIQLRNKSAYTNCLTGTGLDNQIVNRASIVIERIA